MTIIENNFNVTNTDYLVVFDISHQLLFTSMISVLRVELNTYSASRSATLLLAT